MLLNGAPIHTPSWQEYFLTPEGKAGLVACAFNICASAAHPKAMAINAVYSLIGFIVMTAAARTYPQISYQATFGPHHKQIAIDTAPDNRTPPTSRKNKDAAASAMHATRLLTVPALAALGSISQSFSNTAGNIMNGALPQNIGDSLAITVGSMMLALYGSTAHRFYKVAQRNPEWAIIDMPAPEKQTQRGSSPLPRFNRI